MFTGTLIPYQVEPCDRMVERGSMLVAFDMGLGKTPMTIAAVEELLGEGLVETCIVVAQAGLKYQWAEEIATFSDVDTRVLQVGDEEIVVPTDEFCVVIDGPPERRRAQYAQVMETKPDYVVMAYDNVLNDWKYVRRIKREAIVLDEATAIKTFKAQRTRRIKRLDAPYRYALTGTPIENGKPEEIFSIMQWVDESVLGNWENFERTFIVRNNFGGVTRYKNLHVFHKRLAEACVRKSRNDPDVAPFLPKVHEEVRYAKFTGPLWEVYSTLGKQLLTDLRQASSESFGGFDLAAYYAGRSAGENSVQGRIMAKLGTMERLLKHPQLVIASALDYANTTSGDRKGSAVAHRLRTTGALDSLREDEPKLTLLLDTLDDILDDVGNKAIVFATEPLMLQIIADRLPDTGLVLYHGGMNAREKAEAKTRFLRDPDTRLFLTSDAGGYGINLPVANYLVNYDLPWQAGRAKQRNSRHDRASSTFKDIYVINLLVQDSVEERKYAMLQFKAKVSSAIVDGRGADEKGRLENDVVSLTQFLEETLHP